MEEETRRVASVCCVCVCVCACVTPVWFEQCVAFSDPTTEIPIYHILNARITFSNLNGCEEGGPGVRGEPVGEPVEGDGQRDTPSIDTPSPGSDSSSVSSSSSTSETHTHTHTTLQGKLTQHHIYRMVLLLK